MSRGSPALKREVLSLAFIPEHDLLHPIASGAYGQVWLARNRLGVYRAVKIVHRAASITTDLSNASSPASKLSNPSPVRTRAWSIYCK